MNADELAERLLMFAARIGKEACGAESSADFIHKLRICLKELRECSSWLRLIIKTELLPDSKMSQLLDECTQLCNIIGKSIVTAKSNNQ
jgi:four helix bundle protein